MNDPLQNLLDAFKPTQFPPNSRYATTQVTTRQTTDGRTVLYLRRRFVPPPEHFALLNEHFVAQGDRLDNITARYIGDPERFWQICDANGAMRPDELTDEPGRVLHVTLPDGIPGAKSE